MQAGARYIAADRGIIPAALPVELEFDQTVHAGPLWQRARMDLETVLVLAGICGCTVGEFCVRYQQ
jgi:hypothetical protein